MGEYDSSKTRVQPIFTALQTTDPTGTSWLPKLLTLGCRGTPPTDTGSLQSFVFEYGAAPPRLFLRWLIENARDLRQPSYTTSAATKEKRDKLLAGDPTTVADAIDAMDGGTSHRHKWWCLEGTTMVDCAIFTDRCIVFVEGKRTEAGASRDISWYASRNQVLRNLDCARALATPDGREYYTLLVIEESEASDARLAAAKNVVDPDVTRRSLPHLTSAERREALDHYLGFTTWQEIVRTFDLDHSLVSE